MAPVVAFFNNKGGVGKTSLVYHLACMFSEKNYRVVAADLDPQANLTAAFLEEERLVELWNNGRDHTVYGSIEPLLRGIGDIQAPKPENIQFCNDRLSLLVGDLALSGFEDELSTQWPNCLDGQERAFRVISAFWRVVQKAADECRADLILVDLGPNLGAINRAALIASDYVIVPLAPDLFSIQGMKNLGPTLRKWRVEWKDRLARKPQKVSLDLPSGKMQPTGYIVLQHAVRLNRPVKAHDQWICQIPKVYLKNVLDESDDKSARIENDNHCLALLKHYRSLMPMAQEARKPMFQLQPADGAIGAHQKAVRDAYEDFSTLADKIAGKIGIQKIVGDNENLKWT